MTHTVTRQPETLSKIEQIQSHFRTQIRRGTLVAGDRLPSERQLASELGVNLLTVNKAMAGLESEMLLERQASRGTYIHPDVSRGQIMVIFDARLLANPEVSAFYQCMLTLLTKVVKQHGMRPLHMLGHGQSGDEFIQSLEPQSAIWRQASGVLAMADLRGFEDQIALMGIPAVTLSSYPTMGHHTVVLDIRGMVIKAYEHLVAKGCRRIALICNNVIQDPSLLPDFKNPKSPRTDLLDHLNTLGPGIALEHLKVERQTAKQGYLAMRELWESDARPDGVIISDDNTAMGVGQAVLDLQIDTPRQLKLIAHETRGVPRDFPIDFTRVQFDLARIGRGAFGLLYRLMLHERDADRLILKAAICQGSTT